MLSVIIPARNEEFLKQTIMGVLSAAEGEIEVIVVLDGYLPDPPIETGDKRVTFLPYKDPVGQRAGVNEGVSRAQGKYIMKLDAHCMVDQGFDVKLAADCEHDWTVIPRQYNLHAFDWVCKCGQRWYQDKKPDKCDVCGEENIPKEMIWQPRWHKMCDFAYFDKDLHFQWWNEYKRRAESKGDIADVMSCLGACFFMEKDRFLELEGLDEKHGSWGQVGTEIACKSWLAGGRMVVNKKTWYSHLFRTTSKLTFPYPIPGNSQERAREYSRDLWLNNKWPKQVRKLAWLVEKFRPPTWEQKIADSFNRKSYYMATIHKGGHTIKTKAQWMGVPIIKYPNDIILYQEIIHQNKPDIILEAGTDWGGSALFFAHMFDIIGNGQVITIDKYPRENRPVHPRITYINGRSTSVETLMQVQELIKGKTVMVSLDSDHTRRHVKRELRFYGPMVTPGQYMVVEETNYPEVGGRDGPDEAVKWYLERATDFVVVPLENKWIYSTNPGGWLRKREDKISVPVIADQKGHTTIIYLTDNTLAEPLASRVRELLVREAHDIPIISVSQKPIELGTNICLGEIGRNWLSLYRQMMAGIEATQTPFVAIAEHDCLYTHEHLSWIPPTSDRFYYNHNFWLVQWGNGHPELAGMYSHWPNRYALSQLVCSRDLLKASIKERLALLENGYVMAKGLAGAGEPGVVDAKALVKAQNAAVSGKPIQLQRYLHGCFTEYKSEVFKTELPNLDIRHGGNFTGPKRGKERTYDLPYWGNFKEVMGNGY